VYLGPGKIEIRDEAHWRAKMRRIWGFINALGYTGFIQLHQVLIHQISEWISQLLNN
jgi:hypothetical protein